MRPVVLVGNGTTTKIWHWRLCVAALIVWLAFVGFLSLRQGFAANLSLVETRSEGEFTQ